MQLLVRRAPLGTDGEDRVTLDQAVGLVQVEMRRLQDNASFRRRYLGELLRMIESDDEPAVVAARCSALGLRVDRGLRFVVACVEQGAHGVDLNDLPSAVLVAPTDDCITGLAPVHELDDVVAGLRALPQVTAIGVSEEVHDIAVLRRGLLQARRASRLAPRLGDGTPPVLLHRAMRHHRALLDTLDEDAAASFRDAVLGPLLEYDHRRDADLVTTLETFLASNGRWSETARELNIHQNTLRYRLTRVEALTGTRLADISDRVDFYLALALHRDRQ